MRYVLYIDIGGYWRWRLVADDNRTLADSGNGYLDKADCLAAIELVKKSGTAPVYDQ